MKLQIWLVFFILLVAADSERSEKPPSPEQPPQQKAINGPLNGLSGIIQHSKNISKVNSSNMPISEISTSKKDVSSIKSSGDIGKNDDPGLEDEAYAYESEENRKAKYLTDAKNARQTRTPLRIDEKEITRGKGLKMLENVKNLPEKIFEFSNTRDEVGGIDEERTSSEIATGTSTSPKTDIEKEKNLPVQQMEIETCRFGSFLMRNLPVQGGVYGRITCFFCHYFIPEHRREFQLEYNTFNFTFSYGNLTNEAFDPTAESWGTVRGSLIDGVEGDKLEDCCLGAAQCCQQMNQGGTLEAESEGYCPGTWDGWSCISEPVPAGTTVPVKCPDYAYTGYPECYLYAEKTCTTNATWYSRGGAEYTDYSLCSMERYHVFLGYWELAVHCVSILVLVPALLVLLCCKSLQKLWFKMLANFCVALLLRSVWMVVELSVIKIPENKNDSHIMEENGVGCKVIVSLRKMSVLAVWVWMLANSVFLYRSVARALRPPSNIRVYYLSAWGSAILLTGVWAVCRGLLEDYQCWLGDLKGDPYKLYLITDIPCLLSLLVSVGLLGHLATLIYDTMSRAGDNHEEGNTNKKAAYATIVLVPMFGLQFLLTAVVFTEVDCTLLKVNVMIITALTGLQGVYCSAVYCFMNAEVKKELQKSWNWFTSKLGKKAEDSVTTYGQSSVTPVTVYSTVHSEAHDAEEPDAVELLPLHKSNIHAR